jgi:hypothetical protein
VTPLEQVDHRIRVLAARIHASEELLPGYRHVDSGRALIEHDGHFHYMFVERGERYDMRTTDDLDELMYWTFETITLAMAGNYELMHRNSNAGDIRRLRFAHQLALLGRLDPAWADRCRAGLDDILSRHPYVDGR